MPSLECSSQIQGGPPMIIPTHGDARPHCCADKANSAAFVFCMFTHHQTAHFAELDFPAWKRNRAQYADKVSTHNRRSAVVTSFPGPSILSAADRGVPLTYLVPSILRCLIRFFLPFRSRVSLYPSTPVLSRSYLKMAHPTDGVTDGTNGATSSALCESVQAFLDHAYDYIVVGGGTAGLVLASRLTENPNVHVGVLEAGKNKMADMMVNVPALYPKMLGHPEYDWMLSTVPQVSATGASLRLGLTSHRKDTVIWSMPKCAGRCSEAPARSIIVSSTRVIIGLPRAL